MTIAVALSGGLDSLMAAHLLKQESADIFGVHFITGYEPGGYRPGDSIRKLSEQLDIPIHIIDIRNVFREQVVDYFIDTYGNGKTPNPCVVCNKQIKFGVLLANIEKMGADRLATGHYARIRQTGNRLRLRKGVDEKKDQSYFLSMLSQAQLAKIAFPLGDYTKDQVRQLAAEHGLQPVTRKESQDICFIPENSYRLFLETHLSARPEPGPIVDLRGRVLGEHQGLYRYTIGQRRGINCPAAAPYYVLRLDVEKNQLVVGFKDELYEEKCYISGVNWIDAKPDDAIPVKTRVRYRHHAVDSTLIPLDGDAAIIRFGRAQPALTPGQAAVCYDEDLVVAGGWIREAEFFQE